MLTLGIALNVVHFIDRGTSSTNYGCTLSTGTLYRQYFLSTGTLYRQYFLSTGLKYFSKGTGWGRAICLFSLHLHRNKQVALHHPVLYILSHELTYGTTIIPIDYNRYNYNMIQIEYLYK